MSKKQWDLSTNGMGHDSEVVSEKKKQKNIKHSTLLTLLTLEESQWSVWPSVWQGWNVAWRRGWSTMELRNGRHSHPEKQKNLSRFQNTLHTPSIFIFFFFIFIFFATWTNENKKNKLFFFLKKKVHYMKLFSLLLFDSGNCGIMDPAFSSSQIRGSLI